MKTFIKAFEYGLLDVIQDKNYILIKVVDGDKVLKELSEYNDDKKMILLNIKTINIITCT